MPDENKLTALREGDFCVLPICASCIHYNPGPSSPYWGTCPLIRYQHEKHGGDKRDASVPIDGWCPLYVREVVSHTGRLQAHDEFFKIPPPPVLVGSLDEDETDGLPRCSRCEKEQPDEVERCVSCGADLHS